MWTRLRSFPWRASWLVFRHGLSIAFKAAVMIEQSGMLKSYPELDRAALVAAAIASTADRHPALIAAAVKYVAKT